MLAVRLGGKSLLCIFSYTTAKYSFPRRNQNFLKISRNITFRLGNLLGCMSKSAFCTLPSTTGTLSFTFISCLKGRSTIIFFWHILVSKAYFLGRYYLSPPFFLHRFSRKFSIYYFFEWNIGTYII